MDKCPPNHTSSKMSAKNYHLWTNTIKSRYLQTNTRGVHRISELIKGTVAC